MKRRVWLIIAVTLVALATAGIALVALKPVYSATALVLVDPSKKNLLEPETQFAGSSSDSLRVDSEVELVKSETTLLAVAQELDLATDPEFGLQLGLRDMLLAFFRIAEPELPTGDEALSAVLGSLRDAITVQRRGITFLIAISARSGRPEFSARLANSIARTYIQQQLEAKVASTLASRDIIQARIADASATVAQSENAFDAFIDQNLPSISEATGRSDFAQLRAEIDRMTALRARSASTAAQAEQSLAQRDWAAIASTLKDEAVANLERQRLALAQRLASAASGSQVAIDLRSELAAVEQRLDAAAARAVTGLKHDLANSQARVDARKGGHVAREIQEAIENRNLDADDQQGEAHRRRDRRQKQSQRSIPGGQHGKAEREQGDIARRAPAEQYPADDDKEHPATPGPVRDTMHGHEHRNEEEGQVGRLAERPRRADVGMREIQSTGQGGRIGDEPLMRKGRKYARRDKNGLSNSQRQHTAYHRSRRSEAAFRHPLGKTAGKWKQYRQPRENELFPQHAEDVFGACIVGEGGGQQCKRADGRDGEEIRSRDRACCSGKRHGQDKHACQHLHRKPVR